MFEEIHLNAKDIPPVLRHAFPNYKGHTYKVEVTTSVPIFDVIWGGGTRNSYKGVDLHAGRVLETRAGAFGVWPDIREGSVDLQPGQAIVRHSIFQGRDTGITIYVHPADVAQMQLGAPVDLTADERTVIEYTASLKSSYGGDSDYRFHEAQSATGITKGAWEAAKASCMAKGLLDKRGAVTTAGRNARRRPGGKKRHGGSLAKLTADLKKAMR